MLLRSWLNNRLLVLKVYTALIACSFALMQLIPDNSKWNACLHYLIMTASLPIGPLIDLMVFKAVHAFPRLGAIFNILLPVLVTLGVYVQWKYLVPWSLTRSRK